jgi:predicted NUDIX family phosphoesterase
MGKDDEILLTVERARIEALGLFQGLTYDTARYLPMLLNPAHHRFVRRGDAETDPSLKQLIPYFLIEHGGRIWCYVRGKQSGEGRLVAKASIGIGGHINHDDVSLFGGVYETAARRELEEEVSIPAGSTDKIVALLNDDSNDVGKVHLGVVHVLRASTDEVSKRESKITESGFKTLDELRAMRERLETWSQLCLDGIDKLLAVERSR